MNVKSIEIYGGGEVGGAQNKNPERVEGTH